MLGRESRMLGLVWSYNFIVIPANKRVENFMDAHPRDECCLWAIPQLVYDSFQWRNPLEYE